MPVEVFAVARAHSSRSWVSAASIGAMNPLWSR